MQQHYKIATLYSFTPLDELTPLRSEIHDAMHEYSICGTLLLAHEGINGTIAGMSRDVDAMIEFLLTVKALKLQPVNVQHSYADKKPFLRAKVKIKKEIVTMGVCEVLPSQHRGTYLSPEGWNKLLDEPDVLLLDTRNDYEYSIGTFTGAINPNIQAFRDFPNFIHEKILPKLTPNTKVAMFCTGGIRCEKSTSLLNLLGIERKRIFHLQGGILNYLTLIKEEESKWQGECFVFDHRVSVMHELHQGSYEQCFACRYPISKQDMQSEFYQEGVSCPHCIGKLEEKTKMRASERQKQITIANLRGQQHLAVDIHEAKQEKQRKRQIQIANSQKICDQRLGYE